MKAMRIKTNNYLAISMLVVGILSRFIPHPPNFTAIGAIALFGGAYFANKNLSLIIPIVALFVSDLILEIFTGWGFHRGMPFVYGAFILVVLLGFYLRKNMGVFQLAGASLLGSIIFFVVTNFGHWIMFYPKTAAGLTKCYTLAIPFFSYNLIGDMFFNAVFFGTAYFITVKQKSEVKV